MQFSSWLFICCCQCIQSRSQHSGVASIDTFPPASLLGSTFQKYITVNSLYSGQCRDLELVSSVARVRNNGSLFRTNVCNLFLPRIYLLSVLSGCPQGES